MDLASSVDRVGPPLLRTLLRRLGDPPIRFSLWGVAEVVAEGRAPLATIALHDRRALALFLADPEYQFGELFVAGRLTVEGDLVGALRLAFGAPKRAGPAARLLDKLRRLGPHDRAHARSSAHHHYDVGNEFYKLWLDERMIYTCAYFASPDDGLEEAQVAKLEHVCRKLALRRGELVFEAGAGWGALALHMARYHGVRVRAWNVSREQVLYARERAEKEGLAGRVEFIEDDYRNVHGRCDAFVSVGMLEHVGPECYRALGGVISRVLTPEGRGLVHSIGRARAGRLNRWTERRVFPGAHAPTLREMMEIFEPNGLAVLDVENLRRHYALTARHWLARFRAARPAIEALVGPERTRTWELYLAGTTASFEAATIELFQVVFNRVGADRVPWSRAHLYTGEAPALGPPAGWGPGDCAASAGGDAEIRRVARADGSGDARVPVPAT
jgi:cyclopropane-fatty-acyl-phospholipid synthase